ncbi:MAG: ribose 5-phosphate isomerase B [Caldisericia bacterium]|jgi:ribose 5-phosphate isomerase B|nr:ribose 5-phosphate isomerase B [Caldisericia bacterium]
MKIAIGSDHAGFELKEEIKKYLCTEHDTIDVGTNSTESTDYPDFAKKVCDLILKKEVDLGILICGTGIGMSITANKFKGIYAALCYDKNTASLSRRHNNANVLCIGGRTTKKEDAIEIVKTFLEESFEGERHERRLNKIKDIEEKNFK